MVIDRILEFDCIGNMSNRDKSSEDYKPELVVAEMKAQIGYSRFLRRIGKSASDSFETCQRLYQKARDVAIKLGIDVTNFPKRMRV